MKVIYSDHAKKRMRERGIENWEIEHLIKHPSILKNRLMEEELQLEILKIGN